MRRISRERVHAAGLVMLGLLGLLSILAVLTGGEPDGAARGWAPSGSLLQPNVLEVGALRAPAPASLGPADSGGPSVEAGEAPAGATLEDLVGQFEGPGGEAVRHAFEKLQEQRRRDEDGERATGLVTGLVTDVAGTPVAEALVSVRVGRRRGRGEAVEGRSDGMGRFSLEVPAGQAMAWAKGDGFARSEQARVPVEADAEADLGTLVLLPASRLVGQVLNAEGQPVLAQVTVRGRENEERKVPTDEEGRFEVLDLGEALYEVRAESPGYVEARQRDVPVSLEHGGEVALTLERAGRLEGTLRLASGDPLNEGYVFVYRGEERLASTRTDETGHYAVESIDPGPVEIFARSDDFSFTSRLPAEVAAGRMTVLDFTVEEGARIEGVVTDPSGQPLEGIEVKAHEVEGEVRRSGTSDAEGRYVIKSLYSGTYRLFVPQEGRGSVKPKVEEQVQVTSGPHARDLVVSTGSVFAGVVSDGAGQPVGDAWVFAIVDGEHRGRVRTQDDGTFRIEGLHADDYKIFVRVEGDRMVSVSDLRLGAEQVLLDQRITVRPPARLRGVVVDSLGQPLEGIQIHVDSPENPVHREGTTEANGSFELGPLYDGDYRVSADVGGLALLARKRGAEAATLAPRVVTVTRGQDVTVQVVVELSGSSDPE